MKIIDTHIHLWDLEKNHYPWLVEPIQHFAGDFSPLAKSYLIGDLHDDASGVDLQKCVHIQAEFDHDQDPVIETAWLQSVADNPASRGMPQGIVAFADLAAPDVEDTLARHVEHANMRGIRQMLNYEEDPALRFTDHDHLMNDSDWQRGFRLLGKYNLSFDLQIWPWQLEEAAQLAKKIPDVPIVPWVFFPAENVAFAAAEIETSFASAGRGGNGAATTATTTTAPTAEQFRHFPSHNVKHILFHALRFIQRVFIGVLYLRKDLSNVPRPAVRRVIVHAFPFVSIFALGSLPHFFFLAV